MKDILDSGVAIRVAFTVVVVGLLLCSTIVGDFMGDITSFSMEEDSSLSKVEGSLPPSF